MAKIKTKNRLAISFSGGETSAMMTYLTLNNLPIAYEEVVVTFANTGQEHANTLKFVDMCDLVLGFNTVWLEADVQEGHRKGTRHRIVTFKTASRKGEPFEAVIAKYGYRVSIENFNEDLDSAGSCSESCEVF